MVDLPEFGTRVRVWPRPGLRVQSSPTAVLDGGTFLRETGKEIEWSPFWHRRLLHGEILLHDPRTAEQIAAAPQPPTPGQEQ